MYSRLTLYLIGLTLATHTSALAFDPEQFLADYCVSCHGADRQKADRRFDQFSFPINSLEEMAAWQEVVDQLITEDMPPDDEAMPDPQLRRDAIHHISEAIAQARSELSDARGHTTLRRLNTDEYRYTIQDLLGLNTEIWDPTVNFPAEARVGGFTNNGEALVTSGSLLHSYLDAAEGSLQRITDFGPKPSVQTWEQSAPFYLTKGQFLDEYSDTPEIKLLRQYTPGKYRHLSEEPFADLVSRNYFRAGSLPFLPWLGKGAPHSGTYLLKVKVAAIGRTHPYRKIGSYRNGDPLVMELVAVDRWASVSDHRVLHSVELTNAEPKWLEFKIHLEKGFEPEIRFRNGPETAKKLTRLLIGQADEHEHLANLYKGKEKVDEFYRVYQGPRLRVYEVEVAGPRISTWPTKGNQVVYGPLKPSENPSVEELHDQLRRFAERAYRRPLKPNETLPIETLIANAVEGGAAPLDAYRLGAEAVLASPGFLYLEEGEGSLTASSLASRLSYFLWSSMPDDKLLAKAQDGSLLDNSLLRKEADRLLSAPHSQRFVTQFVRSWLELDNIGLMPPSPDFAAYHRDALGSAMEEETNRFVSHILKHNLPLSEFLSADYTFLNRELAAHYGIEGPTSGQFKKIPVSSDRPGGLLSHGSILTASANGVDTSPVTRGIYILDKFLGYTPPPPPDDVPTIEPDIRNAQTIREQLQKHRALANCAECHNKIDPIGFALENFDAVGGWRDHYLSTSPEVKSKSLTVDASGELGKGQSFQNFGEFRELMIAEEKSFVRCMVEKLMTYAIGRQVGISERPAIDEICAKVSSQNLGFRDLVIEIASSDPFLQN